MIPRPERPLDLLFVTWSGGGNLPPVLIAAERMLARGHRVRILSEACDRADCEAVGARFVAWTRAPSRPNRLRETDYLRDWESTDPGEGFMRLLGRMVVGPALAHAEDLREELARAPADLVITSEMLLGVLAACEALRQPVAILGANISLYPSSGAPSVGGFAAPFQARVQLFDQGVPALNAARAELGLAPIAHLTDQLQAAKVTLLATAQAFDLPWNDRPDDVRYVGPMIGDPPGSAWISPWPHEDARPLVLVSFSTTFQNHVAVLQRVLDGLARLPVRVLLTTGDAIDPAELRAGQNAIVLRRAPHGAVMREAALVITHGGHGTVIRALAAGLPTLIVPHGRDQHDNAQRVADRGAGLELPASADAGAFVKAAQRLMSEPTFRAGAERLGAAVRAEIVASTLVQDLEAAARQPVPA